MKKIIRITESELHNIIESTVKKLIKEDYDYMSDDDINKQYEGMSIISFGIEPLRNSDGWKGYFELEFPNGDDIDYDSYCLNNFFVYDLDGRKIAWDRWMPNEQTHVLEDFIRQEIAKRK